MQRFLKPARAKKPKSLPLLFSILAVLLVLLAGLLYARPVDVHTLGGLEEIDSIYISVSRFDAQEKSQSLESVTLDASDPRFAALLEQMEALEFQRSPLDLVTRHFRETYITGSPVQPDTYHYLLRLRSGETHMQLQFFMDRWDYFMPQSRRNLPVSMKDAAETGNRLGAFLWETVQCVPS